ncbi:hypothetical protein [Sandarakinorhabdus rubra]|uniref:hypothetical protein n=1 Tax=Sandarakinorhabdus rubra TaxID=2672568 RepID=UPI0013DD21E5|nr:hypothetical protein [Sandarakinorhabdus rubra]
MFRDTGTVFQLPEGVRRVVLQRPAPWADAVLRLALGLVGTLFTTLVLWGLAPPPL